MRGLVEFLEVNVGLAEVHGVHSASYIHADDVRNGFACDGHGRADGAAFSGVHVRHDADFRAFREVVVAHSADLLDRLLLDHGRVAKRRIHFSYNFKHCSHFLLLLPAAASGRRVCFFLGKPLLKALMPCRG